MHILGILEFPQRLTLTKTVHFNLLNYKIQQLAKDITENGIMLVGENVNSSRADSQSVVIFLLSFRSQPQHLGH